MHAFLRSSKAELVGLKKAGCGSQTCSAQFLASVLACPWAAVEHIVDSRLFRNISNGQCNTLHHQDFLEELLVVKCFGHLEANDKSINDSLEEISFRSEDWPDDRIQIIEPSSLGVLGALGLIHNAGMFFIK